MRFEPQDWDLGLETRIRGDVGEVCESIGHRPLQGRCPKGKMTKVTGLTVILPFGDHSFSAPKIHVCRRYQPQAGQFDGPLNPKEISHRDFPLI